MVPRRASDLSRSRFQPVVRAASAIASHPVGRAAVDASVPWSLSCSCIAWRNYAEYGRPDGRNRLRRPCAVAGGCATARARCPLQHRLPVCTLKRRASLELREGSTADPSQLAGLDGAANVAAPGGPAPLGRGAPYSEGRAELPHVAPLSSHASRRLFPAPARSTGACAHAAGQPHRRCWAACIPMLSAARHARPYRRHAPHRRPPSPRGCEPARPGCHPPRPGRAQRHREVDAPAPDRGRAAARLRARSACRPRSRSAWSTRRPRAAS